MPDAALAFADHDHAACRRGALSRLRRAARARGLRLTPARVRVLEILTERHRAVGAYELLERLRAEGLGRQPPAIYRALDFLIAAGFVHRIERLNAFVACARPGTAHRACFLICAGCRTVAEVEAPALDSAVAQAASRSGFAAGAAVVEVDGTCPACRG